ncbi:hypothetical protein N0V90_001430 [Kalmusia sp. IMI 367209]|nr:hypothetical protein N0V90_001430 [Kalmusia sp. IMI 367209]
MAGLEYGSAYVRASRQGEEDSVSMLSPTDPQSPEQTQYQPLRPTDRRKSSEDSTPDGTPSWLVSPIQLQESIPYEQHRVSSPTLTMGFSVFGGNTASETPYQEQVAWANSTQFRTTQEPKPQMVQTTFAAGEDEVPPPSRKYFRHPRHMLEPWTTGVWMRFPWWGFGALSLVLLLTGASAGILLASHGTSLDDWKIGHDNAQPHVYISVFEMVMNFLILFALVDGVVIRFWRQLLQGTTLDSLHDTYESVHLWSALTRIARLNFNIVAIACVLASISFARGPLFHRALTIAENDSKNVGGAVDLKIAPHPILQFFQSDESDPHRQGDFTSAFSDLIKSSAAANPLPYESPDSCGDYCTGVVKGYTFKASCNSTVRNIDLSTFLEGCKSCTTEQCTSDCQLRRQADINPTFFSISYAQQDNSLILTSIHKNTTSCKGDIQVQTCTLTQAMSDLPVILTNDTIDMQSDAPSTRFYDEALPADDAFMQKYWPLAFDALFPSLSINVTTSSDFSKLDYNKCVQPPVVRDSAGKPIAAATPVSCSNSSTLYPSLLINDPSIVYMAENKALPDQDPLCSLAWNDPMPDMLLKMQSLAFRTTVAIAKSPDSLFAPSLTGDSLAALRSTWTQRISVTGRRTLPLYHTSPLLVALGIAVSLAGVAAVVPLYYGFWEMGRKVSLDPLEIARAFGAPMMDGLDGNTTADMITVERGGMVSRRN